MVGADHCRPLWAHPCVIVTMSSRSQTLPYSWKFSRDKNFEVFADFDLSAKIKTSK